MCSQISFIRYCAMLATRISKLAHFFQQNVTAAGRVYGHERVGGVRRPVPSVENRAVLARIFRL